MNHNYDHTLFEELDKFIKICKKYKELYIYGAAHNQKMLAKYLDICGIKVRGLITSETLCDVTVSNDSAIILGLSDKYYNEIYRNIASNNIIFLSERAKQAIASKMTPRKAEEFLIEINLADHCNLNCQMCDHYSPLVKEPSLPDIVEFERDLSRLSELSNERLFAISLCGGEPLLNKRVGDYLRTSRKHLKNTALTVYTNGILLLDDNANDFWRACSEENVAIVMSIYPIKLDIGAINRKAIDYGVKFSLYESHWSYISNEKYSYYYKMSKERIKEQFGFIDCYQMNQCSVLRNGKIFACPTSAYIDNFNNYFGEHFELSENDYIDIHKVGSFEEIAEFASRPVPFCSYCDIGGRELRPWRKSRKTIEEYI